jgi:hypothetical protein
MRQEITKDKSMEKITILAQLYTISDIQLKLQEDKIKLKQRLDEIEDKENERKSNNN